MTEAAAPATKRAEGAPLRLFLVAGEHSGDALGARLMEALVRAHPGPITFDGVGGDLMAAQGLASLFPLSDVAVMGPFAILRRLAPIVRRVYQTIDAGLAFAPDALVIIDSPEFTHPIARRIRRRRPAIPIIDYVSPSVWAWRPGRAKAMTPYVEHLLALLPFEPAAHARLGGPACTYVGHPLIERLDWLAALDPAPLAERLGLDRSQPVLVVLPGSRRSEVGRLIAPFAATVELLAMHHPGLQVIVPAVPHVRADIERGLAGVGARVHIVEGELDKWCAFKLARAALAASGTVTLELALARAPFVVAYRVDALLAALLRRMATAKSAVLPNLVLGENAFPEFLQEAATPERLAAAIDELLRDGTARTGQLAALARVPELMRLPSGSPSDAAAAIVLDYATRARK